MPEQFNASAESTTCVIDSAEALGKRFNRMLKKPLHGLFQLGKTKMRFCLSSSINDLQSLILAAPPCAAIRLLKNAVFQQPVKAKEDGYSDILRGIRSGSFHGL